VQLPLEEIASIIRPCGLVNRKSEAILQLSKILIDRYQGKVPKTFEELESLPGVGHKTASIILMQAFHQKTFPVDTHVFRLARRWGLSEGKTVEKVEQDLKRIFPKKLWPRLHLQMVAFGKTYCPAKGHKIESCPVCSTLRLAQMDDENE
jgi:endonuclease III